ncbi:MAG: cation:proton antiporter [Candidatus Altiarchaeota archaeon]
MSLLLFVALAGHMLASKLRQPSSVGIILAGILIGPSWLNMVTYTDIVSTLAHLGAVILLFSVGLNFRLDEITKVRYFFIALAGVIIPWIGGYYISKAFGFDFGGSVFIGTVLTATSIAVTASALQEMKKLHTEAAKAIIGAAVIDDILALLALSFSQELVVRTVSATELLVIGLKAVSFLIIGAFLGFHVFARIISGIKKISSEVIFISAIMTAFLYSVIAAILGMSPIIGAFLAGVSLNHVSLSRADKGFKYGVTYMQIIFASIFFASLGVLVDLHTFTPDLVYFLIALTVVAILTKLISCGTAAKLQGMSLKDSLEVGLGMSPRGEVALIVALIGLNKSLISRDIYSAIVVMIILTTLFMPMMLKRIIMMKKYGQESTTPSHADY